SPCGDDHVLLAIGDGDERARLVAAVAGVEPPVDDGLGRLVGLVPVPLEDVVGAREDLTLPVNGSADANRGHARATQPPGPLPWLEAVPLGGSPVDGQERSGLGESVNLD